MGKYKIKKLYENYFQKSRVFLYPALEIKRSSNISPIQTYISWDNKIEDNDRMLICEYELRNDPEFLRFEETKLLNNPLFCDYFELSSTKALYVFTFEEHGHDWFNFKKGIYSKLSTDLKRKIKNFYGEKSANYKLIHSYLYPDDYYIDYANLLNVSVSTLKEVGQLCSKPDIKKELFKIKINNGSTCNITKL